MRLPPISGEWIDRSRPLAFTFEGRAFTGFAGDTVASALLAAGTRALGRSFKYHRARGALSAANHDINAMLQDGTQLNLRADAELLRAGMQLTAVNTFGGIAHDRGALLDRLGAFLPVGFYYKAFHTRALFPLWERLFRRLTGLGRPDFTAPHQPTPKRYDFCDVLVVGGGPSGLAAALAAAEAGADVVLTDENARAGGSGLYAPGADDARRRQTLALLDAVSAHPRIRMYSGTFAAGWYADHWVPLVDADKLSKLRARSVVVATGAFEQPAVFRNNDLPGVMLASGAQRLLYRYAVRPAQRVVILTANADGYRAALDAAAHGIEIAAVVDLRERFAMTDVESAVPARGIPVLRGACVQAAVPNARSGGLRAVQIAAFDPDGQVPAQTLDTIACDGLFMSVGYAPAAQLLYQSGASMRYDDAVEQFVPERLPDGMFACGKVNGVHEFAARMLDGERAGRAAAAHAGHGAAAATRVPAEAESPTHRWPVVAHAAGREFVDFDEDVQLKDFANAVQEGFDNIELLKRYTTVGMGPSQGKHSNMNALRILARLTGKTPPQVGTTTARPFFHPVPLSHLAGRGFTPERVTPLDARHAARGAVFMPAGAWRRPEYYARAGALRRDCIRAEVRNVREAVGLIDVGTLGKLEVRGPQAAELLERVYTGRYANMKVGTTRYALMCDEAGVVIDDGVVARLDHEHFYFTTTTSGAAAVYREITRLNTQWRLDCGIVNLTGAMAAMNLAGPHARAVLATLTGLDLAGSAFPYLAAREGEVAGIPARLMRVGFVGEWGYEIHVPAEHGAALWDALMASGAAHGIAPFGVEAQRLLRLEKGHIIVGQDTDGLTTPFDAGLDWAVKMDKPFFIGQRSLRIVAGKVSRQRLTGFTLEPGFDATPPEECHLVIDAGAIAGRVTSIAWSAALGRHIGLAFLRPELATAGRAFTIRLTDGHLVTTRACATPFYDPQHQRQKEVG